MNLVLFLYRKSWKLMLLAILIGTASGVAGAGLIAVISDAVASPGPQRTLALAFFGLCLLYLLTRYYSQVVMLHLVQGVAARLRVELSRKVLSTPYRKLQTLGSAKLLVILTQDVERFIAAFQVLPTAIGNAVVIAASLAYMGYLSWEVLLVFSAALAMSLLLYRIAQRRPTRRMREVRETLDAIYRNFRGLVEGSKELKLNAERGRGFVENVITPDAEAYRRVYIEGFTGYALALNIVLVLVYLFIGALVFLAPAWISLTASTITAVTMILLYINGPLNALMAALPSLSQAGISLRRIEQLEDDLAAEQGTLEGVAEVFQASHAPLLQLCGVTHAYQGALGECFVLGPMDLQIKRGEVVFILGGNGSGKTTLAMVLLGLYAPESGEIVLDGVPVTDANRAAYRQHFSAVFSDFHLFDTLPGNDVAQVSEQANHYLRKFQLEQKTSVAEGRISTLDLSSGQRRRLALVSAYLEDRPIYLFDEWAADQDPVFKRIFYMEILPDLKRRGKTVIVITHDDAYFQNCDRAIRLRDGMLDEEVEREPALLCGA